MSSNLRSTNLRKLLALGACLCIGILLFVTFAQALDSCEFARMRTTQQVSAADSVRAAPTVCLVCAAAHAASLPSPISSVLVPVTITGFSPTPADAYYPALQMFALHVRPPPAAA